MYDEKKIIEVAREVLEKEGLKVSNEILKNILKEWEDQGLIKVSNGKIEVLDKGKLRQESKKKSKEAGISFFKAFETVLETKKRKEKEWKEK